MDSRFFIRCSSRRLNQQQPLSIRPETDIIFVRYNLRQRQHETPRRGCNQSPVPAEVHKPALELMSDTPEKKEFIHWQEMAQQLGADPSDELMDYFAGTAQFEGEQIDDDDFAPADTGATASSTDRNQTADDDSASLESTGKAAQPVDSGDEVTETGGADQPEPGQSDKTYNVELGIDWAQAPVKPVKKPERKSDAAKAQRSDRPKPETKPTPAEKPDTSHWDSLASSLGIEVPTRAPSDSGEVGRESSVGFDQSSAETEPFHGEDEHRAPAEPPLSTAGLSQQEAATGEQLDANILDEMFVPPETPFKDPELESSKSWDDEDLEVPVDEPLSEGDDSEFIEFEVEELEPSGESGRSESRGRPPERSQRTSRENGDRPSKRRDRSRRPPRTEERQKQRGRRDDRDRDRDATRQDDDRVVAETDADDKPPRKGRRKKQINLPTWQETVDTIVDSNLASRKKTTRRRRGRGSRRQ